MPLAIITTLTFFLSIAAHNMGHLEPDKQESQDFETTIIRGIDTYITDTLTKDKKYNYSLESNTKKGLFGYLKRFRQYLFYEPEHNFSSTLIVATAYMAKHKTVFETKSDLMGPSKIHLLFAVCLRLADKILTDQTVSDVDFAQTAGLAPRDYKNLERELLQMIDYRLLVTKDEFEMAKKIILLSAKKWQVLRESSPRGQPQETAPKANANRVFLRQKPHPANRLKYRIGGHWIVR